MSQQEKITFGEMRASGASRVIVRCGDYKCGHSVTMYPALWPDNVRLSDLGDRFVCTVCGHRGADVRPLFEHAAERLINLARRLFCPARRIASIISAA